MRYAHATCPKEGMWHNGRFLSVLEEEEEEEEEEALFSFYSGRRRNNAVAWHSIQRGPIPDDAEW